MGSLSFHGAGLISTGMGHALQSAFSTCFTAPICPILRTRQPRMKLRTTLSSHVCILDARQQDGDEAVDGVLRLGRDVGYELRERLLGDVGDDRT